MAARPAFDARGRWRGIPSPPRPRYRRGVRIATVVTCAMALACSGDRVDDAGPAPELRDIAATVRRMPIDSDNYVLIPDRDPDVHFIPDELPQAFREDGLRVRFDAERAEIPSNVRLMGPPIRLLRIRVRDDTPRS